MSYKLSTTVLKAFQILEFVGAHQPVPPAKIVKDLGLNRTNVHRLLATLTELGYVTKTQEGFGLTFKLLKLGRTIPLSKDLRNTAKPYMIELMAKAKENVYLCVLVENMVFAIDDVKSAHELTLNPNLTYSYPAYSCASGKVFLAGMAPAERVEFIKALDIEKLGRNTITDVEELNQHAEEVRERGYAKDIFELSNEILSVAVPIFNHERKTIATIAISGPSTRLTEADLDSYVPDLTAAASSISRYLANKYDY